MNRSRRRIALGAVIATSAVIVAIVAVAIYRRTVLGDPWADWTGLEPKTLWDWLDLLIVPLALAVAAFLFNVSDRRAERRHSRELADHMVVNQQRMEFTRLESEALREYFRHMSSTNANDDLVILQSDSTRGMARVRTLVVLNQVGAYYKSHILNFLYEASLVKLKTSPFEIRDDAVGGAEISLDGANFAQSTLRDATLPFVNLTGANFHECRWEYVDLQKSRLVEANFTASQLQHVDMQESDLRGANFSGSTMTHVNMRGADLRGTIFKNTERNLADPIARRPAPSQADRFETIAVAGAKYDKHTQWPFGFDPVSAGAKYVGYIDTTSLHGDMDFVPTLPE
jgi:uncharacterized protein YjbI with pentapeptide repeats